MTDTKYRILENDHVLYCITMASNSNTVVFYIVSKERC